MKASDRDRMDSSTEKIQRREMILDLLVTEQIRSFVGTDYPGRLGRIFMRRVRRMLRKLDMYLVNKKSFKRDYPGDSLIGITKIRNKNIFDVIQSNDAEFVDIDLCGGMSLEDWRKIAEASYWRVLVLTFTPKFRHKELRSMLKPGEDVAMFMEMMCQENGWKPPRILQHYQRPNKKTSKNVLEGILKEDKRSPWYWTFLLTR